MDDKSFSDLLKERRESKSSILNDLMEEGRNKLKKEWPILAYFKYDHLPTLLQKIAKTYFDLAYETAGTYKLLVDEMQLDAEEMKMALRKLLEARNCACRAFGNFR